MDVNCAGPFISEFLFLIFIFLVYSFIVYSITVVPISFFPFAPLQPAHPSHSQSILSCCPRPWVIHTCSFTRRVLFLPLSPPPSSPPTALSLLRVSMSLMCTYTN